MKDAMPDTNQSQTALVNAQERHRAAVLAASAQQSSQHAAVVEELKAQHRAELEDRLEHARGQHDAMESNLAEKSEKITTLLRAVADATKEADALRSQAADLQALAGQQQVQMQAEVYWRFCFLHARAPHQNSILVVRGFA